MRGRTSGARGQTTLDFAFGIGIFLLVVAFVFLFVPSMLDPVSGSSQDDRVVADRVATQLATGMLVTTPANPYVLNTTCADAFFSNTSLAGCRFNGTTLYERLGTGVYQSGVPQHRINVTLSGDAITTRSVGDTPSGAEEIVTARRAVYYQNNVTELRVTVW